MVALSRRGAREIPARSRSGLAMVCAARWRLPSRTISTSSPALWGVHGYDFAQAPSRGFSCVEHGLRGGPPHNAQAMKSCFCMWLGRRIASSCASAAFDRQGAVVIVAKSLIGLAPSYS
jgi:hypothetical protein